MKEQGVCFTFVARELFKTSQWRFFSDNVKTAEAKIRAAGFFESDQVQVLTDLTAKTGDGEEHGV